MRFPIDPAHPVIVILHSHPAFAGAAVTIDHAHAPSVFFPDPDGPRASTDRAFLGVRHAASPGFYRPHGRTSCAYLRAEDRIRKHGTLLYKKGHLARRFG
jgi:hypothetical protein